MTCESVYVASAGGWVNRNDCKGTPTCGMRLTYGGPAVAFADPFPDPSEIPDSYPALTLEELMTKYMKWVRQLLGNDDPEQFHNIFVSLCHKYRQRGSSLLEAWDAITEAARQVQYLAWASIPEEEEGE